MFIDTSGNVVLEDLNNIYILEVCTGRIFQSGPGPARRKEEKFRLGPGPARPGPKEKLKFRSETDPARKGN